MTKAESLVEPSLRARNVIKMVGLNKRVLEAKETAWGWKMSSRGRRLSYCRTPEERPKVGIPAPPPMPAQSDDSL